MRACVVVPTYRRTKRGVRGPPLRRALASVAAQTVKPARVYVSGDHYDDEAELAAVCAEFAGALDIVCSNSGPGDHYRAALARHPHKLWCVGGGDAVRRGVERAVADGMDWYFHLDDDDAWAPEHLRTYLDAIAAFPTVAFVVSKAKLGALTLPRQHIAPPLAPNNYRPKPCDSIHATWAVSLPRLGAVVRAHYAEEREWALGAPAKITGPSDARLLEKLRDMDDIDTLCLPTQTVFYSGDSRAEIARRPPNA